MPTILLTWELGGGLGHLLPLRALGQTLISRGHRVFAALRDASRAQHLFANTGISILQTPIFHPKSPPPIITGFSHLLATIGFDDAALPARFSAWNSLFDSLQPDLVVADHSPTALLALHGRPVKKVNINLPFSCPPDTFPLPYWWIEGHTPPRDQIIHDEILLTEKVNRLLAANARPKLQTLAQLFNQLDDIILATYRELDPYGDRKNGRYWGHWGDARSARFSVSSGQVDSSLSTPPLPSAPGQKIFAYLKPTPHLPELLHALAQLALPTLLYIPNLPPNYRLPFTNYPSLHLSHQPIDLSQILSQCDLVILNAGHGTTASALLAGKRLLLLPMYTEQLLTAQAVARLGACEWLPLDAPPGAAAEKLHHLLTNSTYATTAQSFAARYAGFSPGHQLDSIATRLENLAAGKK